MLKGGVEDSPDLYVVTAFDPGGTTGAAMLAVPVEVLGPPPFRRYLYERELLPLADDNEFAEGCRAVRLEWKAEVEAATEFRILDNIIAWNAVQFTGDENSQADSMAEYAAGVGDFNSPIVAEQFILRQFRQDAALLSPVRVLAKFEYAVRRAGWGGGRAPTWVERRPVLQQPSLALGSVTDERLKEWYGGRFFNGTIGAPHARDAVRHAITFLRREKTARARGKSIEAWPWARALVPSGKPNGG